jgi:hypothetical protein
VPPADPATQVAEKSAAQALVFTRRAANNNANLNEYKYGLYIDLVILFI